MKKRKNTRIMFALAAMALMALLAAPLMENAGLLKPSPVSAATLKKIYIPLALRSFPNVSIFGAALDHITASGGLDRMEDANISWTRPQGIEWSSVEATKGVYNWSALSTIDTELQNAANSGIKVVMLVHSTPEWARKYSGTGPSCGPMAADKISNFANFMKALVARYSVAPYNVKYWEIWNEEDVLYQDGNSGFGCWGDSIDTYFGGGYYAQMLKAVYPQIKAADPQAQVLIGGLLMDCDPRGGCAAVGHDSKPGMFLEGILRTSGAAAAFDGVSFHAYDYYWGASGVYINPNWVSTWNTTGPVLIAKTQFIKGLLTQYSASGKFLMNTEVALICGNTGLEPACTDGTYATTKAYYIAESYAAALGQGLKANIWYSVLGWRGSGLLDQSLNILPAYTSLAFARSEIRFSTYVRDVTEFSGVKGYEVDRGDRHIWVLWSLDGSTHTITLPSKPLAAYNSMGSSVTPHASMDVTLNPLYLEMTP
jgi:hypothetical protein